MHASPHPLLRLSLLAALAAGVLSAVPEAHAASITGVCPDGSIFIVQDRSAIPCARAKEVTPSQVPPMRPEYLPRPYSWQVYREGANPNNPYNLIDSARRVRSMRGNATPPEAGAAPGVATTEIAPRGAFGAGPATPQVAAAPPAPSVTLSTDELRDLFLIVELAQRSAPSRFLKEDARGQTSLEVSFAYSPAFEARVRESLPGANGPVLIFTVLAHQAEAFHPNFTFVQDHDTFTPAAADPEQLAFLEGQPGLLPAEGVALGYVVLTDRIDLSRSLDLYWNDRRIETLLQP